MEQSGWRRSGDSGTINWWLGHAVCLSLLGLAWTCLVAAQENVVDRPGEDRALFDALDASQDGKLTLEEYLQAETPEQKVRERDFQLFDWDENQSLSFVEFRTVPGNVPLKWRLRVPHPLFDLSELASQAIEESFGDWAKTPERTIDAREFVTGFLTSFSENKSSRFDPAMVTTVDRNEDGQVSLEESREFLRKQIGVDSMWGSPLILSDGRMVDVGLFYEMDVDATQYLSGNELASLEAARGMSEGSLEIRSRVANPRVDFQTYARDAETSTYDPVAWFREADTNLDTRISREELIDASSPERRDLARWNVGAFDRDGDALLSLSEYLLSMHGNRTMRWEVAPYDRDGDGQLAFSEFRFDHPQDVPILRRFFFGQLDQNHDRRLTPDEYPFVATSTMVHRLSYDGTVCEHFELGTEFPQLCQPRFMPSDGEFRLTELSADRSTPRRFTFDFESRELTKFDNPPNDEVFGDATFFAWAPAGNRFAMLSDGKIHVVLDSSKPQIIPIAPESLKCIRFGEAATWTVDGKSLLLILESGREARVASIHVDDLESPIPKTQQLWTGSSADLESGLALSPDGKRLVLPLYSQNSRRIALHEIDVDNPGAPREIRGDTSTSDVTGCCFSPDGKWLVYTTWERGNRWN
ncbi:MAG: PD40 domain-containing protein [Planctomycetaceae bacterium]|nr:PD40 domain-containing protein [Planctomycetaceae bacterium]MCB9954072.1 PD40 domain-containing protein [Planctomycetaceae bacterium]